MHHYRPWRIHAHVTIMVLGLLLERIIGIRSGDTQRDVLDKLQTIKVVECERDGVRIRQTTEVRDDVKRLVEQLNVAHGLTSQGSLASPCVRPQHHMPCVIT